VALLPVGCPRNRGLFPGKGKKLISSRKRPASLPWVLKAHFPEQKRLGLMLTTAFHLVLMRRNSGATPSLPHTLSWHLYGQHIPCLLYAYIERTLLASLLYSSVEISRQFSAGLHTCLNSRLQDWFSCTTQDTIVRTDELTNSNSRPILPITSIKSTEKKTVSGI